MLRDGVRRLRARQLEDGLTSFLQLPEEVGGVAFKPYIPKLHACHAASLKRPVARGLEAMRRWTRPDRLSRGTAAAARYAGDSRITDADTAENTAALVRNRILQNAAAAVLAQANQQPALALTLLHE